MERKIGMASGARIVAGLACWALLAAGCGGMMSQRESPTIEVTPGQPDVRVQPGQEFVIRLPSDPRSGYEWRIGPLDEGVAEFLRAEYRLPEASAAGGEQLYYFRAVEPGQTQVRFNLERPYFGSRETAVFDVTVASRDG